MPISRPVPAALVVGFVAVAAQAPAIRGVHLWDDVLLVGRTDLYTSAARWAESVTAPLGGATFYWRPAATTSFLVESLLHGGAAWGFRLTAALLHGAASVLAFTLFLRLAGSSKAALLAALAFALHPVNVETVTWISARFDLCAGLFSLAALAAIPSGTGSRKRWALVAISTLAACCSKESAFLLPLLALVWTEATGGAPGRARLAPAASAAAGVAAALFLRFEALGFLFRTRSASVAEAGGALQHLLLVGRSTATSLATIVFPWGTVGPAHHATRPVPADDPLGWTGLALGAALVAVTVMALRKRRRVGLLLVGLLASLAPASQIVPLDLAGGLHAADRYLYLPSFFAVAAVAAWLADLCATRPQAARRAGFAAAAVVVALAAGRLVVLPRWNDPVRFWTWAVEMAPASDVIQGNLAHAQLEAGRFDAAEEHARRAGLLATSVLTEALVRQGRAEEALKTLDAALSQRPDDAGLHVQRGEIHLAFAQTADALQDFEAAIGIEDARRSPAPAALLARALAGGAEALASTAGRGAAARERADRAERAGERADAVTWLRIARAWIALREPSRAGAALERAESLGAPPSDVGALRDEVRRLAEGKGADGR